MFGALILDLRQGFRWFARSPGVTTVAAASLAIGIAVNAAVFGVTDALLFRPLPVNQPDGLVDVFISADDGDPFTTNSYPDYLDLRARNGVFSDLLGFSPMIAAQNLEAGSRLLFGEIVTGNYFAMLGVPAQLGRTIRPEDDRLESERVAMVSDGFWRRELGGAADALGRTIRIRGHRYTIVGVVPRWFTGMTPLVDPAIWVPLARIDEVDPAGISESVASPTGTSRLDRRGQRWLFMKGRLKPGVGAASAQANLQVVMNQLAVAYPETNKGRRMSALPTSEVRLHPAARQAMLPVLSGLMTALGLALLIVCANVANMLLARVSARTRELAVRRALGGSRWQVLRQLLVENLVLAAVGGTAGVVLAWWIVRGASSLDLGIPIPISLGLQLNVRVVLFTLGITALAGIAAGLAPALRAASRTDLMRDLHARGDSPALGGRRLTLQGALVGGQIAMTMVLLVSAGLLTRSVIASARADVGFDPKGLAALATDPAMAGYDDARSRQFWEQAVERVKAIPEVERVALAARLPFSMNFSNTSLHIAGHNTPGDSGTTVSSVRVSPEYFDTLGVRILQGRTFTASDTPETRRVAVVNETMAKRFWPKGAVGQRVMLRAVNDAPVEIVGVVADHRIRTVGEGPQPQIHFAATQRFDSYQVLAARTRGDAEQLLGEIRRTLLAMEPNLVFVENQTMESQVAATLLPVRAGAWLVGIVGLVGAGLAAIGLYGVIAYSVARRTREIGIRLAIGATPWSVLAMVARRGGWLILTGIGVGVLMAAGAAVVIAGAVYGVTVTDPVAWAGSATVVLGVSSLASLVPAWRASRLDPVVALRVE